MVPLVTQSLFFLLFFSSHFNCSQTKRCDVGTKFQLYVTFLLSVDRQHLLSLLVVPYSEVLELFY